MIRHAIRVLLLRRPTANRLLQQGLNFTSSIPGSSGDNLNLDPGESTSSGIIQATAAAGLVSGEFLPNMLNETLNYGACNDSIGCGSTLTSTFAPMDSEFDINRLLPIIATAFALGLMILSTIVGNVFVIAAILLERNLQNVSNYLILSLAVADLLVSCLVMPLGAVYEISKQWSLGPELCDMWTSSDVLCCTASILHLVAIALDRYWAVTNIDYIHQRTSRRIAIMITIIWVVSFFVCIAPMLGWKDDEWEDRIYNNQTCLISQDLGYQIFATLSSFYVPLVIILILYWKIFQTARSRIRRRANPGVQHAIPLRNPTEERVVGGSAGRRRGIVAAMAAAIGRPVPTVPETATAFTTVSSMNTSPEKQTNVTGVEADLPTTSYQQGTSYSMPTTSVLKEAAVSKREKKAARTLVIITGAFVICWLPFFILAILLPMCKTCEFNEHMTSFFLWMGYFNSTLNPILYTIFSPEFRHAFKRILCGRPSSASGPLTNHPRVTSNLDDKNVSRSGNRGLAPLNI